MFSQVGPSRHRTCLMSIACPIRARRIERAWKREGTRRRRERTPGKPHLHSPLYHCSTPTPSPRWRMAISSTTSSSEAAAERYSLPCLSSLAVLLSNPSWSLRLCRPVLRSVYLVVLSGFIFVLFPLSWIQKVEENEIMIAFFLFFFPFLDLDS